MKGTAAESNIMQGSERVMVANVRGGEDENDGYEPRRRK
jgi:hypothetical protein